MEWIRLIFLAEGVAMLVTGPFLMLWPQWTVTLYGASATFGHVGSAIPWFGALVLLMGWVETRKMGRLDAPEVEAWLIADVAYAFFFHKWVIHYTPGYNLWSLFSIAFPILWAPLRVYWLYVHSNRATPTRKSTSRSRSPRQRKQEFVQ